MIVLLHKEDLSQFKKYNKKGNNEQNMLIVQKIPEHPPLPFHARQYLSKKQRNSFTYIIARLRYQTFQIVFFCVFFFVFSFLFLIKSRTISSSVLLDYIGYRMEVWWDFCQSAKYEGHAIWFALHHCQAEFLISSGFGQNTDILILNN